MALLIHLCVLGGGVGKKITSTLLNCYMYRTLSISTVLYRGLFILHGWKVFCFFIMHLLCNYSVNVLYIFVSYIHFLRKEKNKLYKQRKLCLSEENWTEKGNDEVDMNKLLNIWPGSKIFVMSYWWSQGFKPFWNHHGIKMKDESSKIAPTAQKFSSAFAEQKRFLDRSSL